MLCNKVASHKTFRSFRLYSTSFVRLNSYSELRRTVSILIALIALTHSALAQDTSKIPTLQLWYEAKGIGKVNYLENFDVANGGTHAIAVNTNCGETWYLGNGRIDTANKFCWGRGGGFRIDQLDLNGDGITDYFHDNGDVFQGIQNGTPPNPKAVAKFEFPNSGKARSFGDFNNDGKQDIIDKTEWVGQDSNPSYIGKILLGNADLTKLKIIDIPRINSAYSLQYIVGAWRDSDGSNKMVIYQQTDTSYTLRTEAFFLYSFQIQGDKVSYTALDTTTFKDFKDKWTPSFLYNSSSVWHSQDDKEHTLVVGYNNQSERLTDIYKITSTSLSYVLTKRKLEGLYFAIKYGVFDKRNTGYIRGYSPFMYLYEGNPTEDTVAKAWIYSGIESATSIGDINNDGHGDIAVQRGETISLYLGRGLNTSVDASDNSGSITLNNNQPCSKNGILNISISSSTPIENVQCSLYSLQGKAVADLGTYPTSSGSLSIPLSRFALSPGLYNLRCTIGKQIIDKGLIITE